MISFEGVGKWFGALQVLRGIDLEIEEGSVVVICGPSGSGKSTLLRAINGLERIQAGTIRVMGQTLDERTIRSTRFRADIGMVFQKFSLYPHLTVMDNMLLAPRKVRGQRASDVAVAARALLDRVGVGHKADDYPSQLSGGQQQRVAISRALIMQPKIMLFDEPTSALDPEMIREVLDVMRDLARSGMTMVIVTHEIGFAREVADRVVFMDEGQIVEVGDRDAFFGNPQSDRARRFIDKVLHH
ncbi:amino acid ABC transporter ATP-binding protein [Ancylobacter sp. GSK1Z-4-2]|nr:amino acid ABC transporter ATP-binding protein [Ancylobacter mangrovi]